MHRQSVPHTHRRPRKRDFEGKTILCFTCTADNVWKFVFTDGTSFAVQSETCSGCAIMELCEECG